MTSLVHTERHDDVVVIVIDHPPVNALSAALRRELLAAIKGLADDPGVRAGVIACAGKTFIAGADIREFDAPPPGATTTHEICAALDNSAKPVVAALHGTALGGGFEVALACRERVLAPDGRVGLPEVRIELLPGAGGTQRVPRLIGAMAALEMITSGRHIPADEAMKLGLVDEIATDLRACAITRARSLADAGPSPRLRDRAVPRGSRRVRRSRRGRAQARARRHRGPDRGRGGRLGDRSAVR